MVVNLELLIPREDARRSIPGDRSPARYRFVFTSPELVRHGTLRIGTWHAANQAFRGEVDELKLYAYALGEAAIRASAARGR